MDILPPECGKSIWKCNCSVKFQSNAHIFFLCSLKVLSTYALTFQEYPLELWRLVVLSFLASSLLLRKHGFLFVKLSLNKQCFVSLHLITLLLLTFMASYWPEPRGGWMGFAFQLAEAFIYFLQVSHDNPMISRIVCLAGLSPALMQEDIYTWGCRLI